MINLIRGELYKLMKSKYFLFCNIAMAGTVLLLYVLAYHVMGIMPEGTVDPSDINTFAPTGILEFTSTLFQGNFSTAFVSVAICLLVTNEFRLGTIKSMAAVNRRPGIYLAKLFMGLAMSFALMLTAVAMLLPVSVLIGDVGGFVDNLPFFGQFLWAHTLFCFAMSSLYIMVSFLIRNIAAAMPVCIFLNVILLLALQLLGLFHDFFKEIAGYMPDQLILSYTTPEAFSSGNMSLAVIACIAISMVSSVIGALGFHNADL